MVLPRVMLASPKAEKLFSAFVIFLVIFLDTDLL